MLEPTTGAIDGYIRAAGLKHPAVVGHSLGGVMALLLAADHPGDIGKVMIVDSLAFFTEMFAGPSATVAGAKPYARMRGGMLKATDAESAAAAAKMAPGMATPSPTEIASRHGRWPATASWWPWR